MYKVIKKFTDLQDDGHIYNVGDTYPRDGKKVSPARVEKLLGKSNRQGIPLIAEEKGKQAESLDTATTPAQSEVAEQGTPLTESVANGDNVAERPASRRGRKANK